MSRLQTSSYSDKHAIREILGSLMVQPHLMRDYPIMKADFPENFHKLIFASINNLYKGGAENIDAVAIDEYLSHYEAQHTLFQKNKGIDFVTDISDMAEPINIKYYYDRLKKFTLLRRYVQEGQDVKHFYDPNETDPTTLQQQRQNLENSTIQDIISYYKIIHLQISAPFSIGENRDSKKAGVGGREQVEKWKKSTAWGFGYASAYLTTALHGIRTRRFTVKSAGTGVGKTRTTISDIGYSCSPAIYDKTTKQWKKNPNGVGNGALYIGTEMELLEEIDPILWAYMADVPQENIEFANYVDDEEERVLEAIRILEDEGNIWLEYLPSYDSSQLAEVIEQHKLEHNISMVFFDYIHTTVELIGEFASQSKTKMVVREDQVLANLSNKLKGICRRFDVSLDTSTQVSGDFKNEANRDSTIVRGAKSIIDKADTAMIAMPPTEKELKKIESILRNLIGNDSKVPNLVYSLYKNRGGKWNKIKIWLYVDYDTMRTYDLFVTDYEYRLLNIEKTFINITEDNIAQTTFKCIGNYSPEIKKDEDIF